MSAKLASLLLLLLSLQLAALLIATAQRPAAVNELGLTTAEMVEARGYLAQSHRLPVEPGYVLDLVQVVNPKMGEPARGPVIFFHGIATDASIFLIASTGSKLAKNYATPANATTTTIPIRKHQSARSLPLLLSNLGYSVWLVNRRPAPTSQKLSGQPALLGQQRAGATLIRALEAPLAPLVALSNGKLLSQLGSLVQAPVRALVDSLFNSSLALMAPDGHPPPPPPLNDQQAAYWNFSMDVQAELDVPKVVQYVLERTGAPKVALVGHSLGAAIVAMALTLDPELNEQGESLVELVSFMLLPLLANNQWNHQRNPNTSVVGGAAGARNQRRPRRHAVPVRVGAQKPAPVSGLLGARVAKRRRRPGAGPGRPVVSVFLFAELALRQPH